MREYAMGYPAVLALPLRTFWSLNKQVDRLRAEADQRAFRLHAAIGSEAPDSAKQLLEQLRIELDTPMVVERGFDEERFRELQAKFASGA